MNRLHCRHPFLAPAGEGGGDGAGAGVTPPAAPAPASEPTSAAAAHGRPADGGNGDGTAGNGQPADGGNGAGTGVTPPAAPAQAPGPTSAAAAHAPPADGGNGTGGGKPAGDEPAGRPKPDVADLSAMSDEDYAKAVIPDVDGEDPDRSLIGAMSQGLRELGVQPGLMQKIAALYTEKVRDALAKDDAERAAAMKELNAKCEAEITEQQWADFGAAYADCIAGDEELKHLVDHTELGSSPAFIRLCALAGATLRVERTPAATASAGSGQADLNRKLFEATVPPDLR